MSKESPGSSSPVTLHHDTDTTFVRSPTKKRILREEPAMPPAAITRICQISCPEHDPATDFRQRTPSPRDLTPTTRHPAGYANHVNSVKRRQFPPVGSAIPLTGRPDERTHEPTAVVMSTLSQLPSQNLSSPRSPADRRSDANVLAVSRHALSRTFCQIRQAPETSAT